MEMAEFAGILGAQIVLAFPTLYFLVRALQGGLRSRRMANFGLACGLMALVMPETLFRLSPAEYPGAFIAIGVARVLLGVAGVLFAALAWSWRSDGGVGLPRLFAATALSLLHVVIGTASLMYADVARPRTPQVYSSPDGAFQLTLPSADWQQTAAPNCVVAFSHDRPAMFAKVRTISREQERSDFDALAQLMIERIDSLPRLRGKFKMEDGSTPSGSSYRYFHGLDQTAAGGPVFGAYSVVWSQQTKLLAEISFEGMPKMLSSAGQEAEMKTIEEAARTICLSIE